MAGTGSSYTAQNVTDWGRVCAGWADVTIGGTAVATLDQLRVGDNDGQATVDVSGGKLTVNSTFIAGGGTRNRPVQLTLNNSGADAGEMNFEGGATFNNFADLDVLGGTVAFTQNATFNQGSRFDRSGGTMIIRQNATLTFNNAIYNDTLFGQTLSDRGTIRVTGSLARFNVGQYFDIGNGSLTIENAAQYNSPLTAVITDWAFATGTTTNTTVQTGGLINMGPLRVAANGAANVIVRTGGELRTGNFTTGGSATSAASFTVDSSLLNVGGDANLGQGTIVNLFDPTGTNAGEVGRFSVIGNLALVGPAAISTTGSEPEVRVNGSFSTTAGSNVTMRGNGLLRVGEIVPNTATTTLDGGTVTLEGTSQFTQRSAGNITLDRGAQLNVNAGTTVNALTARIVLGTVLGDGPRLNVSGGVVNSLGGTIGLELDAGRGLVDVSGPTARWNMGNGDLRVGVRGSGELSITNGGQVTSRDGYVALNLIRGGANVTVTGAGSSWTSTRNLSLESTGAFTANAGNVTISAGGILKVGDAPLLPFSDVDVFVADLNPLDANGTNGGLLRILHGSKLTTSAAAIIGGSDASGGRVIVSGAALDIPGPGRPSEWTGATLIQLGQGTTTRGELIVQDTGRVVADAVFAAGTGSLVNVNSGGLLNAASVVILAGNALNVVDASVTGSVELQADSRMSFDNATVAALTQQATADLSVSLRGESDFDNLTVTGAASLEGDIVVSLANGFMPTAGMTFPILTAGSLTATFSLLAPALPGDLRWVYSLDAGALQLVVTSPSGLAGDYNQDNIVDAADYTTWRDNVGTTTVLPNDPTGGTIGVAQYNTWRNNFGQSGNLTALASAESVPEPASMVVMLVLFAAVRCIGPRITRQIENERKPKCPR